MTHTIVQKFLKGENDAGGTIHELELELQSEERWAEHYFRKWRSAQQSVHLTAFGVGMLAFIAGFGICWLVFVR